MSGESSNMYWTVRSKYYVTTTIIPPSIPTPSLTLRELDGASKLGRGVTPPWAHRDPRFKAHYKYERPMSVQRPSEDSPVADYGYFTAPRYPDNPSSGITFKRKSEENPDSPSTLSSKKLKFCLNEVHNQKDVVGGNDLSALGNSYTTNVSDLLAKLFATGLIQEEGRSQPKQQENLFETTIQQNRSTEQSQDVPSVVAGKEAHDDDDDDEWHLNNVVCRENRIYHPACFQHHKYSTQRKFEDAGVKYERIPGLLDDSNIMEDSDVVCIENPVEVVTITDEEDEGQTDTERDYCSVKVKLEPVESNDEPEFTGEERLTQPIGCVNWDTTRTGVVSSIDGNLQLDQVAAPALPPDRNIRINITKSCPSLPNGHSTDNDLKEEVVDNESLPQQRSPLN